MRVIRVEYDRQVNQRRCDGVVNCEEVEMLTDTTGQPVYFCVGEFLGVFFKWALHLQMNTNLQWIVRKR